MQGKRLDKFIINFDEFVKKQEVVLNGQDSKNPEDQWKKFHGKKFSGNC